MKNFHSLVSVIIITYNQDEFLYETIESVLMQDYSRIELIIADDGSSIFDFKRVQEFIERHKKNNIVSIIIIHHETNIGTVRNINRALEKANGDYIKIIAGDDCFFDSAVFSEQIQLLEDNPEKTVAIGWVQQCDKNMIPVNDFRVDYSNMALSDVLSSDSFAEARKLIRKKQLFPICVQASCFRRVFFEKHGFCDERYRLIEDIPIMLRILEHRTEAIEIKRICVLHRGEIGLTTGKGLFNPKREQYYKDNYLITKDEIQKHPEAFSLIDRIELPRVASFFYKMTRGGKPSFLRIVLIAIEHLDALLFFFIAHLLNKVKRKTVESQTLRGE